MRTLRARDYTALLRLIDHAYSAHDRLALFQGLCEGLTELIGISSAIWLPIAVHSRLHQPNAHWPLKAPVGRGILWSLSADEKSAHDGQSLVRLFHEMSASLFWQGEPTATVSLRRQRDEGDFTPRHRVIVKAILPHIARALHAMDMQHSLQFVSAEGGNGERDDVAGLLTYDKAIRRLDEVPVDERPIFAPQLPPMLIQDNHGEYRGRTLPRRVGDHGTIVILERLPWIGPPQVEGYGLSQREKDITQLVIRGLSNKQIAQRLDIIEQTVKDQLHHVFDKMKIRRRSELAAIAFKVDVHR